MAALPSSPSMPPRLITSSTALSKSKTHQANFECYVMPCQTHCSTLTPKLWTMLESAKPGDAGLLPAASALASYDPERRSVGGSVGGKVAQALASGSIPSSFRPGVGSPASRRAKLTVPASQDLPGLRADPTSAHYLAIDTHRITPAATPDLIVNP